MKKQITTNTGLMPKQLLLTVTMILWFGNVHAQPASVTTSVITGITSKTASSGGNIYSDGGSAVTSCGVCWSTSPNPTVQLITKTKDIPSKGSFISNITGLSPGTTYYLKAYATNASGTAYGPEVSFTTQGLASITTTPVSNITSTSASSGGNITSDGGSAVTERGICWSSKSTNPTLEIDQKITSGSGTGSFTCNITGLIPGTTCYIRAYATNSTGIAYGSVVSFATTSATLATLTTTPVSNITFTSASSGGNITSDGGSAVTERGICWSSKSTNPTVGTDLKLASRSGTGSFTCDITGLIPGTTYYIRAYATNSIGTAYGSVVSFATTSATLATLTTTPVSNITSKSVSSGGNITSDGGSAVTARGVCLSSTSTNPTLETDQIITSGSGTGSFTCNITGLIPGTNYYGRAYATNSIGTAYGSVVKLTTPLSLATITTTPVSNITSTSASSGGNITSDGGSAVTERGICWSSQSTNPTLGIDQKITSGSGTGSFTCNIPGPISEIFAGTTYYLRAFAKNSIGTAYGSVVSFTTPQGLASITTSPNVLCGGNILSDGGSAVTERGICWNRGFNPTLETGQKHANGSGTGSFTCEISSDILFPVGTYEVYVRAYAINSTGTAYGPSVKCTKEALDEDYMLFRTEPVTNSSYTSASLNGHIDINDNVSSQTVFYTGFDYSNNPNFLGGKSVQGVQINGLSSLSLRTPIEMDLPPYKITGLTPGTTYYVKAYVQEHTPGGVKRYYGDVVSFTTHQGLASLASVSTTQLYMHNLTISGEGNIYSDIGATKVTSCGGIIYSDGGSAVTSCGVCWSTSPNPTVQLITRTTEIPFEGHFSINITGLSWGTTYYLRAYATNAIGTAYGPEVIFTTP